MDDLHRKLDSLFEKKLIRVTISNRRSPVTEVQKITIRPVLVKGETLYQLERFKNNQAFHENITSDVLKETVLRLLTEEYRQLDALCEGSDISIKLSKKNKVLFSEKKNTAYAEVFTHNRQKKYILDESETSPVLLELGVQTKDGKIAAPMYDKYKQINRFLEFIDDIASKDDAEEFKIIDFGCGKSYLTFVVYEYFIKKGRKVQIVGLDLKRDVIAKCNNIAKKNGYDMLTFEVGDIKDYKPKFKPDMVISLHACDTATDFALFNAINWDARYILSIPCCQHELNNQMNSSANSIVAPYGLLRERFCAMTTDAIRAKLLEYSGYNVSVMEFIDMEHSPKNILIRAKKKKTPIADAKKAELKNDVETFLKDFGVSQTLHTLLMNNE